ncbi:unnamed protein product [Symbiodinium necroappetens]|uniref:Uncharacterized protein n=1 Tax=Symbiodinium necroappetens TaxID=1628268 RepID=A0A812SW00_9DINO|nr:unnamed protein product [Symbiodinium necroappetens]
MHGLTAPADVVLLRAPQAYLREVWSLGRFRRDRRDEHEGERRGSMVNMVRTGLNTIVLATLIEVSRPEGKKGGPWSQVNAACANEQLVGTTVPSGENFSKCEETSNPFSALGLGYFGLMPEKGHYGEPAVTCNATRCLVFVPAASDYEEAQGLSYGSERIIVAPDLDAASTLCIYAIAVGGDDSFHVGNNVEDCGLPCEGRHECPAVTLPYYPGFGGPKEVNPGGQWDV